MGPVLPPFFVPDTKQLFDNDGKRHDVDLARAETDLNNLVERRAREAGEANATEMAWKASVRKHHEKLRRQRRGEWFCYWSALAESLRKSAAHYEAKALELLEDEREEKKA